MLAQGLAHDTVHNRWGVPGQFVGPTGQLLVRLRGGVRQALEPLLDDRRALDIVGSQGATLQRAHGYRICDLAGYLLAQHEQRDWQDSPEPAARDASNAALRNAPGR